jgi:hypothetical protein
VQTITETIRAEEKILDLISTVLQPPALRVFREAGRVYCTPLHIEVIAFESTDGIAALSKWCRCRGQWLGLQRKEAIAQLRASDASGAGDRWYFGAIKDRAMSGYVFAADVVHPSFYLGLMTPLLNVPGYRVPDGPRQGTFYIQARAKVNESFAALLECAEQASKAKLTKEVLRKNYLGKSLVQYGPDKIWWLYWDPATNTPYNEPGPGRDAKALYRRTPATWLNWMWVLGYDNTLQPNLAKHVKSQLEHFGFTAEYAATILRGEIEITYDGPDSNYFLHEDLAWELWRQTPLQEIYRLAYDNIIQPFTQNGEYSKMRPKLNEFFHDFPSDVEGRPDITDLHDDLLKYADDMSAQYVLWKIIDQYWRITSRSDHEGIVKDGWGFYSDRMAVRYPHARLGRPESHWADGTVRAADQYNPYTREGQIRRRWEFIFLGLDAVIIIDGIKGIVQQLEIGVQPEADDIIKQLMSKIGSRTLYPRRLLNALDYVQQFECKIDFDTDYGIKFGRETLLNRTVSRKAFELMRGAVIKLIENEGDSASHAVDLLGALIVRDMMGEIEGHGGMIDALETRQTLTWIHDQMAALPTP